jgi:hypothetical protein
MRECERIDVFRVNSTSAHCISLPPPPLPITLHLYHVGFTVLPSEGKQTQTTYRIVPMDKYLYSSSFQLRSVMAAIAGFRYVTAAIAWFRSVTAAIAWFRSVMAAIVWCCIITAANGPGENQNKLLVTLGRMCMD